MNHLVRTVHGELRGSTAAGVYAFLGVPFAAPPFGANRLRPPRPVAPWSGIRDATRLGPEPPQVKPPATGGAEGAAEDWEEVASAFAAVERAAPSEDCLNLNIWTPEPGAARLPVMVWIQGGMFELSSTAAYDGSRFARDGVVCVVINWRPGAEGFLYLGDGIANLGLLDQLAALQWVQENIAAFGGDPGNVTVFGESAGAMSIGMLLAMPRAEGLFRRAILQSGAAHQVTPAADALAHRRVPGRQAGRARRRGRRSPAVGVERLLAAQAELKGELLADPDPDRWGTAVVASGDAVAARARRRRPAGRRRSNGSRPDPAAHVDVVVGTNTDDWRLWLVASGAIAGITDEILTGPVRAYGYQALAMYGLTAEDALPAYRAEIPGGRPRRSAGGGPDRLVDADPRDPSRRSARRCQRGLAHLYVRIRVVLAGPRRGPRPRDSFRFRHRDDGRAAVRADAR